MCSPYGLSLFRVMLFKPQQKQQQQKNLVLFVIFPKCKGISLFLDKKHLLWLTSLNQFSLITQFRHYASRKNGVSYMNSRTQAIRGTREFVLFLPRKLQGHPVFFRLLFKINLLEIQPFLKISLFCFVFLKCTQFHTLLSSPFVAENHTHASSHRTYKTRTGAILSPLFKRWLILHSCLRDHYSQSSPALQGSQRVI